MPLGAFRINSLAKTQAVEEEVSPRTAGFVNILRRNDVQLSNAQYKFNTGTRGGSILFDGTDDALIVPTDSSIDFSGDFTIEFFIRFNSLPSGGVTNKIMDWRGINVLHTNGEGTVSLGDTFIIQYQGTNGVQVYIDGAERVGGGATLSTNTWYHMALQRNGNDVEFWLDGTRKVNYNQTSIDDYTPTVNQPIGLAMSGSVTGDALNGYMDEIRFSDVARYTSGTTITVPTAAFEPDVNTQMLLHGDGPYGSTGNFHIVDDIGDLRPLDIHIQPNVTQGGTAPSISTTQSKFGGSSFRSYDNEGHCEFASPEWGDAFTIEFWFRADNTTGDQYMAGVWGGTPHGGFNWTIYLNGSTVKAYVWNGSYQLNNATIGSISANTWYHVAVTWDGSTYRTFLNGTMGGTASSSTPPAFDKWQVTWIGTVGGTTSNFSGYIDEFRQSDTARYTASFTAPTSAFTDDANTQVLLHFDGTNGDTTTTDDYFDATADYNQAVTFDGSSDYLRHTSSTGFTDGKQITVSYWVYPYSVTGYQGMVWDFGNARYTQSSHSYISGTNGRLIGLRNSSNSYILRFDATGVFTANQWHHVLVSVDLATNSKLVYVNDSVPSGTWADYSNADIDFTRTGYSIAEGSDVSYGPDRLNADLANFWMDDSYIDISQPTNRAKFISASGTPVDAGTDGSTPTGSQPLIYIKGDAATWNSATQNLGSTSDFTMTGSVTDSSNEPVST